MVTAESQEKFFIRCCKYAKWIFMRWMSSEIFLNKKFSNFDELLSVSESFLCKWKILSRAIEKKAKEAFSTNDHLGPEKTKNCGSDLLC